MNFSEVFRRFSIQRVPFSGGSFGSSARTARRGGRSRDLRDGPAVVEKAVGSWFSWRLLF